MFLTMEDCAVSSSSPRASREESAAAALRASVPIGCARPSVSMSSWMVGGCGSAMLEGGMRGRKKDGIM